MDRNRDGKLSRAEFNLASALPFKRLDLDGDGFITFDEYKKGFDMMDTNKDGKLSKEEFMLVNLAPPAPRRK
jgi:Ca2+-binding EF-hand superfamily protein